MDQNHNPVVVVVSVEGLFLVFKHSKKLKIDIPVDSLIHHIVGLAVVDRSHHMQVEGTVKDILNSHLEDCDGNQVRYPHW